MVLVEAPAVTAQIVTSRPRRQSIDHGHLQRPIDQNCDGRDTTCRDNCRTTTATVSAKVTVALVLTATTEANVNPGARDISATTSTRTVTGATASMAVARTMTAMDMVVIPSVWARRDDNNPLCTGVESRFRPTSTMTAWVETGLCRYEQARVWTRTETSMGGRARGETGTATSATPRSIPVQKNGVMESMTIATTERTNAPSRSRPAKAFAVSASPAPRVTMTPTVPGVVASTATRTSVSVESSMGSPAMRRVNAIHQPNARSMMNAVATDAVTSNRAHACTKLRLRW